MGKHDSEHSLGYNLYDHIVRGNQKIGMVGFFRCSSLTTETLTML